MDSALAPSSTSAARAARRLSPQLQAVVDLYTQEPLADYVLQLDPLGLDTTKMMLRVLRQVEESCWREYGRRLGRDELLGALDALIKDSNVRQQIVTLYEQSRRSDRLALEAAE